MQIREKIQIIDNEFHISVKSLLQKACICCEKDVSLIENLEGYIMDSQFKLLRADEEVLDELNVYLPEGKILQQLADFFAVFSDTTRIRVLSALALAEMCVSDLSNILGINQTTLSHQLKMLKNQKLVNSRRDGKIILYSASNYIINDLMLSGIEHLLERR